MTNAAIKSLFAQCVIPNYTRIPIAIVRGEGSWVEDADGKKYLDLFPGWGVSGLGHCHPKVVAAVRAQAGKLFHVANNYYSEPQGRFAEILSRRASGQQCFFANSGAEANEAAIKLARLHGQPRYKIVTFKQSFHGRTFAAISATGQPGYHQGFTPLLAGFSYADLNCLESVRQLVDDATCAVMVEPVQGEGGVLPCTREFLESLRGFCDEKELLLIFDEVQTAPARLGSWFGYQHFGVTPDILTAAKAIAGGMPLGVMMASPEVAKSLVPGTHASTFGGNAISCAAGIAAFEVIEEEGLLENIRRLGAYIDERLRTLAAATEAIEEVRRIGFMVGIKLGFPGGKLVDSCRENGLLLNCTQENILRLLPAFNVSERDLAQGFDILAKCLESATRAGSGSASPRGACT